MSTAVYDEDAAKLRELADWLDTISKPDLGSPHGKAQEELRRIAEYLERGQVVGRKRYERLIEDQDKLNALEQAGVDNWDGYSHAIQILNGNEDSW